MALPYDDDGSRKLIDGEKKNAILKLVLTLFVFDTIAILGYFYLVFVLGWEGMAPLVLLVAASVVTGMFFAAGKRNIDRT